MFVHQQPIDKKDDSEDFLPILGNLPSSKFIELSVAEPGDQMGVIYKLENEDRYKFCLFDCMTLAALEEIDLKHHKPCASSFAPHRLPDGYYVMSLATSFLGQGYARNQVLCPAEKKNIFSMPVLTSGKHLNEMQFKVINADEILTFNETYGLKIFKKNQLNTYCARFLDPESSNSAHQFNDKIFGLFKQNGSIKFLERKGNEFENPKVFQLANSWVRYNTYFNFNCFGHYIIMQGHNNWVDKNRQTVVYRFTMEKDKIDVTQVCSTVLPSGKFAGCYLLDTEFANVVMYTTNDVYSIKFKNGESRKVFATQNTIKDVKVMRNSFFVHSIDSKDIQHVDVVKYESKELKNILSQNITNGITMFPPALARICADYVGLDVGKTSDITPA